MAAELLRGVAWTRARDAVLANATRCHVCGGALDFGAPPRSPKSPSVDHVIARKRLRGLDYETRRRIAFDPANLRPCHFGCNASKGARPATQPRRTSREW
jgi:5-methylcytosine-specific restriction endonuclease McrA